MNQNQNQAEGHGNHPRDETAVFINHRGDRVRQPSSSKAKSTYAINNDESGRLFSSYVMNSGDFVLRDIGRT